MNERPLSSKNRCPHNVIEPNKKDRYTIEYYCRSCGENIAISEDPEFITEPQQWTEAQRELLK